MENLRENVMPIIEKRDGRLVEFNQDKIMKAVEKSFNAITGSYKYSDVMRITSDVIRKIEESRRDKITVEEIQDMVVFSLNSNGFKQIASAYQTYREERSSARLFKTDLIQSIRKIGVETDRDNANVGNNFSAKMLRIASESNKVCNLELMPKDLAKEHENGDLYYHDLDSYNLTTNCLHIPTGKLLRFGFNPGYGLLRQPKRIETAAELSCIMLQASQNDMFGGQSHPNFDNDLAPYVDMTRKEVREILEGCCVREDLLEDKVEERTRYHVRQAMQAIVYNLNTMHSRAGSQVPFSSVNIGIPKGEDAALICEIFLEEYIKGLGNGEQPIFPNIIFRVKDGVNAKPSDPYYYLFKLACKSAAKRMNPTFMNLDADFNKYYYMKGYLPATMGCRTYLMKNVNGKPGAEGRGNIAPTTINLPRLALRSQGDVTKFFELFNEKIELAKESLLHRYKTLCKLKVKDLPFVAGQHLIKGSEGLKSEDSIEPILKQGTWGIGFIGLAETLVALTGKHHGEDESSRKLGYEIIQHLRDKCDEFTEETHLNWSCYATPAEGLSGKFIVKDKKVFGEIKGVTDKDYYTNSFHIPVGYPISIVDKIKIEAPFHKMCNGGHISYIEVDNNPTPELIEEIITYAYQNTNISYMGINFHIRYCKHCGESLDVSNRVCPKCGSSDIQGISRVTGYLSLDERFGPGKVAERKDRITTGSRSSSSYKFI